MALLNQQLNAVQDPRFRSHWPQHADLFVKVDDLLKTVGPSCPRVAAVWDMLLAPNSPDPATKAWFQSTFPGVAMRAGGDPAPIPVAKPTPAAPSTVRAPGPVGKAIDVLQNFRRRS